MRRNSYLQHVCHSSIARSAMNRFCSALCKVRIHILNFEARARRRRWPEKLGFIGDEWQKTIGTLICVTQRSICVYCEIRFTFESAFWRKTRENLHQQIFPPFTTCVPFHRTRNSVGFRQRVRQKTLFSRCIASASRFTLFQFEPVFYTPY